MAILIIKVEETLHPDPSLITKFSNNWNRWRPMIKIFHRAVFPKLTPTTEYSHHRQQIHCSRRLMIKLKLSMCCRRHSQNRWTHELPLSTIRINSNQSRMEVLCSLSSTLTYLCQITYNNLSWTVLGSRDYDLLPINLKQKLIQEWIQDWIVKMTVVCLIQTMRLFSCKKEYKQSLVVSKSILASNSVINTQEAEPLGPVKPSQQTNMSINQFLICAFVRNNLLLILPSSNRCIIR